MTAPTPVAESLLAKGDFAKAEDRFKAAVELDPKSAAAQLGLGRSRARQNRFDEAAVNFRKAAELDATFSDSLLELAARLFFRRCVRVRVDDPLRITRGTRGEPDERRRSCGSSGHVQDAGREV